MRESTSSRAAHFRAVRLAELQAAGARAPITTPESLVTSTIPFLGMPGTESELAAKSRPTASHKTIVFNSRFKNLRLATQQEVLARMHQHTDAKSRTARTNLASLVTDRGFAELNAAYQHQILEQLDESPKNRRHASMLLSLARHPNFHQHSKRTLS